LFLFCQKLDHWFFLACWRSRRALSRSAPAPLSRVTCSWFRLLLRLCWKRRAPYFGRLTVFVSTRWKESSCSSQRKKNQILHLTSKPKYEKKRPLGFSRSWGFINALRHAGAAAKRAFVDEVISIHDYTWCQSTLNTLVKLTSSFAKKLNALFTPLLWLPNLAAHHTDPYTHTRKHHNPMRGRIKPSVAYVYEYEGRSGGKGDYRGMKGIVRSSQLYLL
jgi:hypothetical protein